MRLLCLILAGSSTSVAAQNWDAVPFRTHAEFQAVNPDGSPAYSGGFPLRLQGVLLNTPGTVFDNSPNFVPVNWPMTAFNFGARQQVYVQATQPDDAGGTAMFLAQSLGNHPANQDDFFSYSDAEWLAEVARVNTDAATGREFQAGDLVEVRARIGLHFSGKFNVNEAHDNSPSNDFDVVLIEAGAGLPDPTPLQISDVKNADDSDLFDPTRSTGGERYQSTRVNLLGVSLQDPGQWQAGNIVTVTDGVLTLPVLLGTDAGFSPENAPMGAFNVVGIFDQEATPAPLGGNNGYRVIVTSPADVQTLRLCADVNGDGMLNGADFNSWLAAFSISDPIADQNNDSALNGADFNSWLANFSQGQDGPRCNPL